MGSITYICVAVSDEQEANSRVCRMRNNFFGRSFECGRETSSSNVRLRFGKLFRIPM